MSQRAATITSLPVAFEVMRAMQAEGLDWGEGYRPLGRQALEEIIEDHMAAVIDRYLDQIEADDLCDRRNDYYRRHLLTALGDIELHMPRTPQGVSTPFRSTDMAALSSFVAYMRARGAARSDRPARAAWAALGLLADVADSFLRSLVGGERWRRRW